MRLYLDAHQGETKNGRAFGYIGTTDTDDDGNEYCGWFFDWPSAVPSITPDEQEAVLESLTLDQTCRHLMPIPADAAYAKLERYLERKFPAQGAGAERTDTDN